MKKSLMFLVLYVMLTAEVWAQFAVATYPAAQQKVSVGFDDGTVITAGNKVMEITTDRGLTWTELPSLPITNILSLAAKSLNSIFITDGTLLYESTNSGTNWQQKTNTGGGGGSSFYLYAAPESGLYLAGGALAGIIKKSTDGGQSFTQLTIPACKPIRSIYFIDGQTGFAGDTLGNLLKTSNAGANWTLLSTSQTKPIQAISFINDMLGYIAVGTRNVLKTTDGGLNWSTYEFPVDLVFRKLQMFSGGSGFVCDENSIYKTGDGGQSWIKVIIPAIGNKFLAAAFPDANNGVFAGNNIYRLDNTGVPAVYFDTPLRNSSYGANLITMSWFSSNLAPTRLTLFLSSNNGQTWEQLLSNLPSDTNNVVLPRLLNAQSALVKLTGGVISATSPVFSIKLNAPVILFSPNEIAHYVQNDGLTSYNRMGSSSGFYWPKNMGTTAIFEDGVVWAGKVGTEVRSGGSAYRSGLQPGNILSNGLPANPGSADFNVWQLKRNWQSLEPGIERSMYEGNYNSWPAELGAPYEDMNHDGHFTRGVDKPRIFGEQTAWFVVNDLNPTLTSFFAGTQPMGIEMQVTEFGNNTADLKNVLFKKVCLINKGSLAIKDYHVGIWSDPDLGDAADDFVGCDTMLNLEYVYNGDADDAGANGYGHTPPALGYYCVQPPVTIGTPSDSAFFFGRYHKGYKASRMESFNLYLGGSVLYKDWAQGQAAGSQQLFNNLNGLLWDGSAILDPTQGGIATKFIVPGDPVGHTGWYEGSGWPGGVAPGDRRMLMSFGPRNFNPGDTMEFVYAYVIDRGSNNINSITKMKELANTVRQQYTGLVATAVEKQDAGVTQFGLLQNYPNPFNPSCRIIYSLAQPGNVSLKVYDVLGNEVTTLTDSWQQAGTHEVVFNSKQHKQLASGVYFYHLQAGANSTVKKMILMK